MASIVERKKRFYVVYMYNDEKGARKQKGESFTTYADRCISGRIRKEQNAVGIKKAQNPYQYT